MNLESVLSGMIRTETAKTALVTAGVIRVFLNSQL